jgi:hypothetical protein
VPQVQSAYKQLAVHVSEIDATRAGVSPVIEADGFAIGASLGAKGNRELGVRSMGCASLMIQDLY